MEIREWIRDRPEILEKYDSHWVVVNVRRKGVSVFGKTFGELQDKINRYEADLYDRGQSLEEVYIIWTPDYSIELGQK